MTDSGVRGLQDWTERLDFLLKEEANLGPDPAQRFATQKQIEEARAQIRRLQEGDTTPSDSSEPDNLQHYLTRLRAKCRSLPLLGFGGKVQMVLELDQVYVPLQAQVRHQPLEREPRARSRFAEQGLEESRALSFDEVFPFADRLGLRGVVVLGAPGSGKTTLLKHLVLAALDRTEGANRLGLPASLVPVLVELRQLSDPAAGLEPAVVEAVGRADIALGGDAAAFARQLLRRDDLLLLVDGLDEVADEGAGAAVARWLERAVEALPGSRFVVTSRIAGYHRKKSRLSGRFLELHVLPLGEGEVRSFVAAWYREAERQTRSQQEPEVVERLAREAAEGLLAKVFGPDPRAERLRDLASNPLMLQILCLIYRSSRRLPEGRVELYDECTRVLLESWPQGKEYELRFTVGEALALLQPLAWWLQQSGEQEAGRAELLGALAGALPATGNAGELLTAISEQSGLLVDLGQERYGFLHLSFQEYLSARHVQDRGFDEPRHFAELAARFGEQGWREVVLLAVGLRNPSLFPFLMKEVVGQKRLHRDPRLADDCLRDAAVPLAAPFLAALAAGVEPPEERYQVLRLLREVSGWKEVEVAGETGRRVVEALLADGDLPVRGLAAELLGVPAVPARPSGAEPAAGQERIHEKSGLVLVYVPGGEYMLGADDLSRESKPAHRVVLSPFWIGKYLVTNEQYGTFLAANRGGREPAYWKDKLFNAPQQPVVGVAWEEARVFCEWAGLAMPSEAQWEAAARGTDQRRYPWGNEEPTLKHANYGSNEGRTTPVGAYPLGAGPFGTLDQAGNVWEWCEDVWDPSAYRLRGDKCVNPVSTQGDTAVRSQRGGSWLYDAGLLPAASRHWVRAAYRYQSNGFRCVLSSCSELRPVSSTGDQRRGEVDMSTGWGAAAP